VKAKAKKVSVRQPRQERAKHTVQVVLDATVKLLKRGGTDAITTNRIAEVAGVCIGSIYQYFPDKRAIFAALHQRHALETRQLIERTLAGHAESSLNQLLRALMEELVDAHAADPELHALLDREIPHRAGGAPGLRGALHGVIASRAQELSPHGNLDRTLFIVPNMMDVLAHEAVLSRPVHLSLDAAKQEAGRAISSYLRVAPQG
jgi:AcrR family transcriptional regulator